jgi:hypothetical protein
LVDGRANRSLIDRLIHQEVDTQSYAKPPVIKWLTDPFDAFQCLSRPGLDELLQVIARGYGAVLVRQRLVTIA